MRGVILLLLYMAMGYSWLYANEAGSKIINDIAANDNAVMLKDAETVYKYLSEKYKSDSGFIFYKSRVSMLDYISNMLLTGFKKAAITQLDTLLQDKQSKETGRSVFSMVSSKVIYDECIGVFSKSITIDKSSSEENKYFEEYYNVKLLKYSNDIAKAGFPIAVACPDDKETYNYLLLLPLLHYVEPQEIPDKLLPKWLKKPEQYQMLSDSCLLHYGLSYHAMNFAKKAAAMKGVKFSEFNYYEYAAEKCSKASPFVATDCLNLSRQMVKGEAKKEIAIMYKIIQVLMDAEEYARAASEAKSLFSNFKGYPESLDSKWLYFYALSKSNDLATILQEIDAAIEDPLLESNKSKLMFIKWWALKNQPDQKVNASALENELLSTYVNDPTVAPIMLSQATEMLEKKDIQSAREVLTRLCELFPKTKASEQAKLVLEKIKIK